MKGGEIVLVTLPQSDGAVKRRPALLLRQMPGFKDWLLVGISTQLHQEIPGFDEVLYDDEPHFVETGLLRSSLIRLGFMSVIPSSQIVGTIGYIPEELLNKLLRRLADYISKSAY